MSAAHDKARQALLEAAVIKEASKRNGHTRGELNALVKPGERFMADDDLGVVSKTNPKAGWVVTDMDALQKWVAEHAPSNLLTQTTTTTYVAPAFLAELQKTGECIVEGGEVVVPDGIEKTKGNPTLRVEPSERAHELAAMWLGEQLPRIGPSVALLAEAAAVVEREAKP